MFRPVLAPNRDSLSRGSVPVCDTVPTQDDDEIDDDGMVIVPNPSVIV
jgi:hypothetical protein